MSVQEQIDRIKGNVAGAYAAVADMGGTLPERQDTANLPEAVRSIPTGGGVTLEAIEIKAPPDRVGYGPGELFDPTGMIVWASLSNGYGVYVNHSDLSFEPAGPLENEVKSVTVQFSWGGVKATAMQAISVKNAKIYGAIWDGTRTTKWTRTDDATLFADPVPYVAEATEYGSPFDNLMPWAGMVRVSDPEAGELVAIPKFWYKWAKNGGSLTLQIADGPLDGFRISPAHMDRGDGKGPRDTVYVGRYHCAGGYTSRAGESPQVSISRSTARASIHDLGETIWQFDYAMRETIQMLYLVEFADWNSQNLIGYGCGNGWARQNTGATDAMPYHTGTMQKSRTTYGVGVQYRHIEDLWGNVYDWVDGEYNNSDGINLIINPSDFSDSSGGVLIGKPAESGFQSAIAVADVSGMGWATYPTEAEGSDSTYITDFWEYASNWPCMSCGGDHRKSGNAGLFRAASSSANDKSTNIGCRVQKIP